jgi:hypothetical protein
MPPLDLEHRHTHARQTDYQIELVVAALVGEPYVRQQRVIRAELALETPARRPAPQPSRSPARQAGTAPSSTLSLVGVSKITDWLKLVDRAAVDRNLDRERAMERRPVVRQRSTPTSPTAHGCGGVATVDGAGAAVKTEAIMALAYDRRASAGLMAALLPGGWARSLVEYGSAGQFALDLQLRGYAGKDGHWATLYVGRTKVVDLHYRPSKGFRLSAHASYRKPELGWRAEWEKSQPADQLEAQWSAVEDYLGSAIPSIGSRFLQEGAV